MKRWVFFTASFILVFALFPARFFAEEPSEKPSRLEMLKKGVYRIGSVVLHKEKGYVELPGKVNMRRGLVELLAASPLGKVHESVFVIEAEPIDIQVTLILLGLKGREGAKADEEKDLGRPLGDPVRIWVEWGESQKEVRHRAEDLIWNSVTRSPMRRTDWIFTGSKVIDGVFMAQVTGSIIVTYHDPYAMIDNPLPCGANDDILFANDKVLPEVGTPVVLIIEKVPVQEGLERKEAPD